MTRAALSLIAVALLALAAAIGAVPPALGAVPDDLREAERLRDEGNLGESAELYRLILEADPENLAALRGLALVLSWDGKYDEAIEVYRRVLTTAPGDDEAHLGLARTYSWSSRFEESIGLYGEYLESNTGDRTVLLESAKVRSWAEDYAAAITIYREHLAAHPDDRDVRLELARVLSWDGQFDASVEEHRVVLAADPDDREARLGLARVLSWGGRNDESIDTYHELLEADPDDRDALRGLAQVLAWEGRYDESIETYERLLALDPADAEAEVGMARALSWSGNLPGADDRYDAVLDREPENAAALLGKAQVAHWRGETRQSRQYLDRAEAAAPGDSDVAALRAEMKKGGRPFLDSGWNRIQDTDGNHYRRFHAGVTVGITPEISLTGRYARTEAGLDPGQKYGCETAPGRWASVDTLAVAAGFVLGKGVRLRAELGADRVAPSAGESTTRAVGSVFSHGPIKGSWRWNAALERRTFDATRVIIDCGIVYDLVRGGASGKVKNWLMSADVGLMNFSDGNQRTHLTFRTSRPIELKGVSLEPGYMFRSMRYAENLNHGYFDPQQYVSNIATLVVRGKMGTPRVDYAVRLEVGLQSFRLDENILAGTDSSEAKRDAVFGGEIRIGWNITKKGGRLEAFYLRTDYAAQNPTGFESRGWGLVFRYRF